jgi:hypothetical protein
LRQAEGKQLGDDEKKGEGAGKPLEGLGHVFKTPSAGAAVSGTLVLGAAAVFGVLETAVAAGAAYVAYQLLRKKEPPRNK